MTKQEILDRIYDIIYQDGNVQALDLLKHDLENDIIEEDMVTIEDTIKAQFNRECD